MKSKRPRLQLFYKSLGMIILIAVSFGAGYWICEKSRTPDENLIGNAYRAISSDSILNPDSSRELAYAAIRGMIKAINDPYAELIEPEAAKNFTNTFNGKTGVVGLYAENKGDQIVITIVFPGGAADLAGVMVGDIIQAIDNEPLDKDSNSSETGLKLRGNPDTTVHLKVLRKNQILEFDLLRQVRKYVTSNVLKDGIGYISLNAFNKTATEEMKEALEALLLKKPSGLIWDLRSNEGGDMQAAQDILSFFIKDGLLFSAELTHDRKVSFLAKGNPIAAELPLVVLMDITTYSAAETCGAAVAETGRGRTIGTRSYGKGLIQATGPLAEDTLLQMTIAKWLSPKGEWYQGKGVTPQIEARDDPATETDELLEAAVKLMLSK